MNVNSWIAVQDAIPWLTLPPYFVAPKERGRLTADLREAGFKVFEADASACATERDLLLVLGDALAFPEYYGVNWAAFEDCVGDLLREDAGHLAVVVLGADSLLRSDLHAFVRSVHLLQEVVVDVEKASAGRFQLEVFFVGVFHVDDSV